jgi:hypothetical protein
VPLMLVTCLHQSFKQITFYNASDKLKLKGNKVPQKAGSAKW